MATIKGVEDKLDKIEKTLYANMEDKDGVKTIPYIVHENAEARQERREKRLVFVIVLLIILLVASNFCWILHENNFEDVVTTTTTTDKTYTADTGDGNGTAVVNENGEVSINGESDKNG